MSIKLYKPEFDTNEFRKPMRHFEITSESGEKIIYAYIRKNACTAFRKFINRKTHPKYVMSKLMLINHFPRDHIRGNMRYFARRMSDSQPYNKKRIFVYRDPIDRVISFYVNKLVEKKTAIDSINNYNKLMGKDAGDCKIANLVEYIASDLALLDVHLIPQKSHLYRCSYQAIRIDELTSIMVDILGKELGLRYFSRKENSSQGVNVRDAGHTEVEEIGQYSDFTANELQKIVESGSVLRKEYLVTTELIDAVRQVYSKDYQMIEEIERQPPSAESTVCE